VKITPNHRRFHLSRSQDVSGVSGTGERIAEGCLFSNGKVVLVWLSTCPSVNIYENIHGMLQVHGHGGTTVIEWDDPDNLSDTSD
jgi:hypothetical protein